MDINSNTDDLKEIEALLNYMIHHNEEHNEEVTEIGKRIKNHGYPDVFELITEATKEFSKGNELLSKALEKIKKD